MKYRGVFFDVGGVLMQMGRERVAREYVALARARGVTLDLAVALRMFSALDDEIPARARAAPPLSLDKRVGKNFWTTLFADGWSRLGLTRDDAAINHLYTLFRRGDFNHVFDDVRPALDALCARGLQLGIVSNFTANLEQVLRALGIGDYFSVVAVSAIVRAEKPDRAIFDYAARAAKQSPRDLLLVGDGIHADVDGARNAGWNAILLDRDNWYPDYAVVPRIRLLTEIVDWV
ncbi:MAG: HAD-IA family hydrolase [Chloroflexota bacterium]